MSVSAVGLCCRTSERTAAAGEGLAALAPILGERVGEFRMIGSPGEPRVADWSEDLRDSRGCLLEAGGQVDDALAAGRVPLLLAGEPSIALTTLPAVVGHRPDVVVLWLDAHGCFNTPATSPSGYLAGMALAGACGHWESGLAKASVLEDRVVLAGVRSLDDGERTALERSDVTVIGASPIETLVAVTNALSGAPVYVHLDFDVIDRDLAAGSSAVPGGLKPEKLRDVLDAVASDCEIVGVEMTGFETQPDDLPPDADPLALDTVAGGVLDMLEPLLDAIPEGTNVRN